MSSVLRNVASAVGPCGIAFAHVRDERCRPQGYVVRFVVVSSGSDRPVVHACSRFILSADLVQDLYIKELKSYKPTPPAKDAHIGVVQPFHVPPPPQVPALPDLAPELSAYD
ncbi:hypothetical protein EWM64_g10954, partial [Hericium alpestre]